MKKALQKRAPTIFKILLIFANFYFFFQLEDERCQVFIDEKVQALYFNNLMVEDAGIYSFSAGSKSTQCELIVSGQSQRKLVFDVINMKMKQYLTTFL